MFMCAGPAGLMPSVYPGKAYVFLQLWVPFADRSTADYCEKRQTILEIACAAATEKIPDLEQVIGIAIDAPKLTDHNSEVFLLLNCADLSNEQRDQYRSVNKDWGFFSSPGMRATRFHVDEFVDPNK